MKLSRMKHSLAVAEKMKKLAIDNAEKYPVEPDEAFVLGMLHDVGYEFAENQKDHADKGGEVLKSQNYKYWLEISFHGKAQKEYDSVMLKLLNFADMTTGPNGEYMTMQERIDDISLRYGNASNSIS